MKNFILLLAVIPILQLTLFAQEGWIEQTSGTTYNLHSVHFADENIGWAVGDNGTILRTTNGGEEWYTQTSNTTAPLHKIHCADSNTGWVIGKNFGENVVLKTTNGGIDWIQEYSGHIDTLYYHSIFFVNYNIGWLAGIKDGYIGFLLKTIDGGENWIEQSDSISGLLYFIDANVGWVGGFLDIYKTTNGGEEWIFQTHLESSDPIHSLQFSDVNMGWVITNSWDPRTGGGCYIMKTSDGGVNWICKYSSSYLNGLPSPREVFFADNNYGWAIADNGTTNVIISSTNGGDDWVEQLNNQSYSPESIYFVDNNTGWAVGTNGLILKYQGVTSIGEERINRIPSEYFLSNNFPNPFNPSTTIRYSIPQSTNVTIKVFDILGSEIETLVNKEKPSGTYEITWNAENLPSGIYFYQLKAGSFVETKKMILLR